MSNDNKNEANKTTEEKVAAGKSDVEQQKIRDAHYHEDGVDAAGNGGVSPDEKE